MTLPTLLRQLRETRKAAKHRSRTGPASEAQALWDRVCQIEAKIEAMKKSQPDF